MLRRITRGVKISRSQFLMSLWTDCGQLLAPSLREPGLAYLALAVLASCQTSGSQSASRSDQCDNLAARDHIRHTIQSFYDALAKDDYGAIQRVVTPDFYAFEIGKRYSGKELSDLIAKSHAEGRIITWRLGPMSMQVDCSVATASWENTGSVGSAGKVQPRAWLESAVLRRQHNRWLIAFLHSTPKDPRG